MLRRSGGRHAERQLQLGPPVPQEGRVGRPEALPGDGLAAAVCNIFLAPAKPARRVEPESVANLGLAPIKVQREAEGHLQRTWACTMRSGDQVVTHTMLTTIARQLALVLYSTRLQAAFEQGRMLAEQAARA